MTHTFLFHFSILYSCSFCHVIYNITCKNRCRGCPPLTTYGIFHCVDSLPIAIGLVSWWVPTINSFPLACTVRISLCLAVHECLYVISTFNSHAQLQFKNMFSAKRNKALVIGPSLLWLGFRSKTAVFSTVYLNQLCACGHF